MTLNHMQWHGLSVCKRNDPTVTDWVVLAEERGSNIRLRKIHIEVLRD
jgi:hypothetical protein